MHGIKAKNKTAERDSRFGAKIPDRFVNEESNFSALGAVKIAS